ncbi:MAG: hypothetical protein ACRDSP_01285 [Pseudonocardiaceae bacterium]
MHNSPCTEIDRDPTCKSATLETAARLAGHQEPGGRAQLVTVRPASGMRAEMGCAVRL